MMARTSSTPLHSALQRAPQHTASTAAGFTLLEMLVVLALIGITMTTAVVSLRGGAGQAALKPVVALVAADLRAARIAAMQRGRTVEVSFDGRARSYAVTGVGSVKRVPDSIGFVFSTAHDGLRPDYASRLLFFADGSSTGGLLTLTSGTGNGPKRAIVLAVDWLTGTVQETGRETGRTP